MFTWGVFQIVLKFFFLIFIWQNCIFHNKSQKIGSNFTFSLKFFSRFFYRDVLYYIPIVYIYFLKKENIEPNSKVLIHKCYIEYLSEGIIIIINSVFCIMLYIIKGFFIF